MEEERKNKNEDTDKELEDPNELEDMNKICGLPDGIDFKKFLGCGG